MVAADGVARSAIVVVQRVKLLGREREGRIKRPELQLHSHASALSLDGR